MTTPPHDDPHDDFSGPYADLFQPSLSLRDMLDNAEPLIRLSPVRSYGLRLAGAEDRDEFGDMGFTYGGDDAA